jgi:hypothetical protein
MILQIEPSAKMTWTDLFFKLHRKIFRSIFHSLALRPGSSPYITGDTFRKLANHIHDETQTFDPSKVNLGDIVFVGNPYMEYFFKNIHPHIQNQYILIQHNGDYHVDEKIAQYIDDKIFKFYAQIATVKHEKIISIPIGIENKHHGVEGFPWLMKQSIPSGTAKKPRIFFHFSIQTNPSERGPALEYFKTHPAMDTIHTFVPYNVYKNILASFCFTASPAGNTLGSHRTWEALYLRTIPIVKRTVDAEAWVTLGLPVWIVDDWHELDSYSESELRIKYDNMMSQANFDAIYMDYWEKGIKADQEKIRNIKDKLTNR